MPNRDNNQITTEQYLLEQRLKSLELSLLQLQDRMTRLEKIQQRFLEERNPNVRW